MSEHHLTRRPRLATAVAALAGFLVPAAAAGAMAPGQPTAPAQAAAPGRPLAHAKRVPTHPRARHHRAARHGRRPAKRHSPAPARGATGPQGPTGHAGPVGPVGPAGPVLLRYVSAAFSATHATETSKVVVCPVAAPNAIGGGLDDQATKPGGVLGDITLEASFPRPGTPTGSARNAWSVSVLNKSATVDHSVLAYAVCSSASSVS